MTNKKFKEIVEKAKSICDESEVTKGSAWALIGSIECTMRIENLKLNADQLSYLVNLAIHGKY